MGTHGKNTVGITVGMGAIGEERFVGMFYDEGIGK